MKRNQAKQIAMGGVFAALALVIMCLGGLIPVATFVCPMLCALLVKLILLLCGERIAWAWYGAVSILSVLLGPDKEAAAIFLFLGYYPIVKPWLDGRKLQWLWKLLLFNCSIGIMYGILVRLLGMEQIAAEYAGMGTAMLLVMLALGNVTFFLLDRLLEAKIGKRRA